TNPPDFCDCFNQINHQTKFDLQKRFIFFINILGISFTRQVDHDKTICRQDNLMDSRIKRQRIENKVVDLLKK
ncbi:MAG: hypothetical protein Q4A59_00655, partial [Erysipelotrichaceae bacterium]|nr:hypothetical protein [Erysipelotrichaceae bacterium]